MDVSKNLLITYNSGLRRLRNYSGHISGYKSKPYQRNTITQSEFQQLSSNDNEGLYLDVGGLENMLLR